MPRSYPLEGFPHHDSNIDLVLANVVFHVRQHWLFNIGRRIDRSCPSCEQAYAMKKPLVRKTPHYNRQHFVTRGLGGIGPKGWMSRSICSMFGEYDFCGEIDEGDCWA